EVVIHALGLPLGVGEHGGVELDEFPAASGQEDSGRLHAGAEVQDMEHLHADSFVTLWNARSSAGAFPGWGRRTWPTAWPQAGCAFCPPPCRTRTAPACGWRSTRTASPGGAADPCGRSLRGSYSGPRRVFACHLLLRVEVVAEGQQRCRQHFLDGPVEPLL